VGGLSRKGWSFHLCGVTPREFGYASISARENNYAFSVAPLTPDEIGWSPPPLSRLNSNRMRLIARALAQAFLSGPWELDKLVERGGQVLDRRRRWLRPLSRRVLAAFPSSPRPRRARLAQYLCHDEGFRRACQGQEISLRFGCKANRQAAPEMAPTAGSPSSWQVPVITTPGALADFLGIDLGRLEWLADCQARERAAQPEPLRHYRYRWMAKASGSLRLIESPKPWLKKIQRLLLDQLLAHIPPHDAAHGFRAGRSVLTFVTPHIGQSVVLKMDIRDFFPSITAARVLAIFLTAGYPEDVARLLAGLCTNSIPRELTREMQRVVPVESPEGWRSRRLFVQPHLPQGAPTSPALANLCAYRLDARLDGLARATGAQYSRYADDLIFSGDEAFVRAVRRFRDHVAAITLEEGFVVQHKKTRVMRQGVRQQAAGVVLNHHPNVPRPAFDGLKAILYNCVRHGPSQQNRAGVADFRAHLAGRIAYVARINPRRGERLRRVFDQIVW
jgi:RNA-directed DNA polymerase